VVSSTPRPHFTLSKNRYPFYRRVGGPQGRSGRAEKSRPHWDSIPDRPARSLSLYRLSYPAHIISNKYVGNADFFVIKLLRRIFKFVTIADNLLVGHRSIIISSRSHPETSHLVGLLWTSDQPETETST